LLCPYRRSTGECTLPKRNRRQMGCRRNLYHYTLIFILVLYIPSLSHSISHLILSYLFSPPNLKSHPIPKMPSQAKPNPNIINQHTKEEENSGIRVQIPSPTQESVKSNQIQLRALARNTSCLYISYPVKPPPRVCTQFPLHFLALNTASRIEQSSLALNREEIIPPQHYQQAH